MRRQGTVSHGLALVSGHACLAAASTRHGRWWRGGPGHVWWWRRRDAAAFPLSGSSGSSVTWRSVVGEVVLQPGDVETVGSVGDVSVRLDQDQASAVPAAEREEPVCVALSVVERSELGLPGQQVGRDEVAIPLGEIADCVVGPVGGRAGEQQVEHRTGADALQGRASPVEAERGVGKAVAARGRRFGWRRSSVTTGAVPVADRELGHPLGSPRLGGGADG